MYFKYIFVIYTQQKMKGEINMKKKIAIVLATVVLLSSLGCSAYGSDDSWKENKVTVDLASITDKYEITEGGVYTLSGNLDGMVYVNTTSTVKLILNNAVITNTDGPAIFFESSEKGIIETAAGTTNTLTDGSEYSVDAKACVFSNDDLDLQGEGTLVVNGTYKHGIASDDDIDVESGTITISSVVDGIHANNDITFEDGTINITSEEDAIQAEQNVVVNGGTLNIEATGEIEESNNEFGGAGGFGGHFQMNNGQQSSEMTDGQQPPEMTDGQQPPEMADGQEMSQMQDGQQPEMADGQQMPQMRGGQQRGEMADGQEMPQMEDGQQPADMNNGERQDFKNNRNFENNGEVSTTDGTQPTPDGSAVSENSTETTTEGISSKGIKADENITINNGTITVSSNDHCIKADGDITVENGTINLTSNVGKGIKALGNVNMNGGTVNITSKDEGIESKAIMTINGGDIDVTSDDDGLNAGGGSGQMMAAGTEEAAEHKIIFNGGNIHIDAKGDGVDSNGNLEFNGGNIDIDGPTSNGDGSIDFGGQSEVTGGTVFAVASSGMVECPDGTDAQKVLNITLDESQTAGAVITIKDSSGNVIAEKTAAKNFQNIIYSSDSIKLNETYTVYINDTSAASVTVTENTASYGNSGRGMGGGMGGGMDKNNGGGRGFNRFNNEASAETPTTAVN